MATTTSSAVHDDDKAPAKPPPVHASRSGVLVFDSHCEYPAVANGADHAAFAVMVTVKAPALVSRAPVYLVVVLDVSESMAGAKLAQVKRAMGFVIDRLGPRDRLSVVAFSGDARRLTQLTRMTAEGKAAAKRAVEALEASGGASANVRAGLDEAAKVLGGRRGLNWQDVAAVILISDGHGTCAVPEFSPRPTAVHTFGLGSDCDAAAMHSIAEVTAGTFSFVEDVAAVQDALAQCVGGLLSVTAMDTTLEINCVMTPHDEEVRITAVKSGSYKNDLERPYEETSVSLGELYADEERRVLFFLDVPSLDDASHTSMWLFNPRCSYTDVASRQHLEVGDVDLYLYKEIERPVEVKAADMARCEAVERELLRVAAAEDMALAREAAERGAYAEAARILDARRESVSGSAPALSGDAMITALVAELHELSVRVSDEREYKATGRACILAGMSAHAQQRGSSVRLSRPMAGAQFGGVGSSSVFATPSMRRMEKKSEMLRKQQEAPSPPPVPLPENGSKTTVPRRSRLEASLASAVPWLSMLRRYGRLLLKR